MANHISLRIWLFNLFLIGAALLPISHSSPSHYGFQSKAKAKPLTTQSDFKVRGANLGGWLVIEGWIHPSNFDGIPNGDFLDGTTLQLKSVTTKKYLCADAGGGDYVAASCDDKCGWEKFRLWRINENTFQIRVPKDQFLGIDGTQVVAVVVDPTDEENFEIIRGSKDPNRVRIKASNGYYLQAKSEKEVMADGPKDSDWGDNDPTVFELTILSQINGDWQLQNGWGPKAAQVMQNHYDTFIVEDDFKFMSENGINAVRIPVGWWTIYDPNPPFPFVSGTLKALDNAFSWAKKYGLKVILDLHSAPGSQNGVAHSTTRDGSLEWGKTNETIQQTLEVIDFYAARYAKHENLYGFELLNEPLYPYVSLKTVEEYYRLAYKVVRHYNPTVYVIFATRLSFTRDDVPSYLELSPLVNSFENSVLVINWYSLFYDTFTNFTAKDHIEYVKVERNRQMTKLLENNQQARIYIGEWSCGWDAENPTEEDLKEFAKAKMEVYDRATFGWTFWTFKNVQNNWSMKWLIENGYIDLLHR
ncbi:putative glucan 1,3-beta-glucosidase A [Senna tora]|uniref:Putative glucan 1,3-beta-glucosidase A n=1 Tax=Senna tora TaxID=362788 RepID=A0A834TGC6_9FABA|nr:putative glucan 1,3-beta-glucosidase A [Senna tora]